MIIAQITAIDRHEGDSPEIHYLKSENRSLVSSMNNMKNLIAKLDQYDAVDNERFAELINQTPFKYLSYRTPTECYQNLLNQQGNRMLIEFSNSEELGLKFDGQLRL